MSQNKFTENLPGRVLLITGLICTVLVAHAQWNWQNPVPQGNDLNVILVKNDHTLWAAGYTGTIMHSGNDGLTWEITNLAEHTKFTNFIGLDWPDDSTGFAVDKYGYIYRTRDTGMTWDSIYWETDEYLFASCFPDARNGFVTGSGGKILRTQDGGETWTPYYLQASADLMGICFTSLLTGYIVGSGGVILKTTNGGDAWNTVYNDSTVSFRNVVFPTTDTGYVCGSRGIVMSTTDGGLSWTPQWLNDTATFSSLACFCPDTLIVNGSEQGQVIPSNHPARYRSTDGGMTWTRLQLPPASPFTEDIAAVSGGKAYAVGDWGCIEQTLDYGNTWSSLHNWLIQPISWAAGIRGMDFPGVQTGYLVVDQGVVNIGHILKTTDGGVTWFDQDTTTDFRGLRAVDFFNENLGCIGGNRIYSTFDGGQTWTLRMDGLVWHGVNSIAHTSDGVFVAVGSYGSFLRSTDYGQSWSYVSGLPNLNYRAVHFSSATNGFAAGDGTLLRTNDAGATWSVAMDGTYIHAIDFITSELGFAVGSNGLILRTSDGGNTWLNYNYPTTDDLYSVRFFDADTGYIAGGTDDISAIILKTTDGGTSWHEQFVPVIHPMYTVAVTGNCAFTGGLWCCMFGTTNGGIQVYAGPGVKARSEKTILYPNPSNQPVRILDIGNLHGETILTALTLTGEILMTETIRNQKQFELNTGSWNPGTYLLHILTGEISETKKIVVCK